VRSRGLRLLPQILPRALLCNFDLCYHRWYLEQMSPVHLLCIHPEVTTELEGCFESILARSWYMADGPPSDANPGERLEWLSSILSDNRRVRAAAFHAAYTQYCCPQILDNETARMALEQQYYKMMCSVTLICRLPIEILRKIFSLALDFGQSRMRLMHVCRHWRAIVEGMSNIWTSLKLQASTAPESVQQSLHRAHTRPLVVEVDIDRAEIMKEGHYSALAIAAMSAPQWETLIITSLPQSEHAVQYIHGLLSTKLSPMNQLRHLRVMRSVSSPLLSPLLQNAATAAVGSLASMEIHSLPAILNLVQPSHASILGSITTFKAHLPEVGHPVDLLPHFSQLKVLELTNLLLPIYQSNNLLLVRTLHHLYLRAVSIQWMGGQVFPNLESCTIIAPPMMTHPLILDVTMPACITFHIGNNDIVPIRKFQVPNIGSLVVKSNQWSAVRGDLQIAHLFRVVFETLLQPHALHITTTCSGKVLLALLQLLPGLKELRLDLARPSALGKHFFTALLAKPVGGADQIQSKKLEQAKGWKSLICPSLTVLELHYHQWLRQSDNSDWLAPLFALSWSRESTVTPLRLDIHFKASRDSWGSFELGPQPTMPISMLAVPSLMHYGQSFPIGLLEHYFTSVIFHSIETPTWESDIYETLVFPFCFNHLQVLKLEAKQTQRLNVLPLFQQLKELSLFNIQVPHAALGVDLPVVHTLKRLSLQSSTLAWMDGQVFAQLERFDVDEKGWPDSFKHKVQMPTCTCVQFNHTRLDVLPLLHSNFYVPSLNQWELGRWLDYFVYDEQGISALQSIQAKTFRAGIVQNYGILLDLLEAKNEVEQLDLMLHHFFRSQGFLNRLSVVKESTKHIPCPNMKVLILRFHSHYGDERGQVSQWCRQMMDERREAGCPMEKCHIWWDDDEAKLTGMGYTKWGSENGKEVDVLLGIPLQSMDLDSI
jgi:hypothetical protein